MKHKRSKYHTLQVLKTAQPKLGKAITQIPTKNVYIVYATVHSTFSMVTVFYRFVLSPKLRKHRTVRKVSDKAVPLAAQQTHYSARSDITAVIVRRTVRSH